MKNRIKTSVITAGTLLIAIALLSACGSAPQSKSSQEKMVMETTAASAQDFNMVGQPDARPEDTDTLTDTQQVTAVLPKGRKLISTVYLNAETSALDDLLAKINAKITELGGYVEQSDLSRRSISRGGEPALQFASLTVRIPNDKMDSFVTTVETDSNVTNKTQNTEDVTLKYSDIESRKKSLSIEQDRIWALLEKAESLDAVISLEQRLSDIRYELESMESQLRLYDDQVAYGTVQLQISEVADFTPTSPESVSTRISTGFTKNLKTMGSMATALFIGLITTSPTWVPLAALALVVLLLGRRHNKKVDHGAHKQPHKPEEPHKPDQPN